LLVIQDETKRQKKQGMGGGRGAVRGTRVLIFAEENRKFYLSQGSQKVPARPSGEGRLKKTW